MPTVSFVRTISDKVPVFATDVGCGLTIFALALSWHYLLHFGVIQLSNFLKSTLAASALAFTSASGAHAATYEISWDGRDPYSLTGQFSFNDEFLNTGAINQEKITSLEFEVFNNDISLGSFACSSSPDCLSINFNFDTTNGEFLVGGDSQSSTGQLWNASSTSTGFGFFSGITSSGSNWQSLYSGGSRIPLSSQFSDTLTATLVNDVAVPEVSATGSLAAIGSLLALMGLLWERRGGSRRPSIT